MTKDVIDYEALGKITAAIVHCANVSVIRDVYCDNCPVQGLSVPCSQIWRLTEKFVLDKVEMDVE